ncbi:hypothetical protein ACO0QE_000476 [Hanseniaspora vineae]
MSTLTQTQTHNDQLKLTTVNNKMATTGTASTTNTKISQLVREKYLNVPLNYELSTSSTSTSTSTSKSTSTTSKLRKNTKLSNKLQYYWYLYLIHLPCHLLLTNIDSFFIYLIVNSILFGGVYYGFSLMGVVLRYLLY